MDLKFCTENNVFLKFFPNISLKFKWQQPLSDIHNCKAGLSENYCYNFLLDTWSDFVYERSYMYMYIVLFTDRRKFL